MLSGRGIDGELKSKFGELIEKIWKSSSWGSPSEAKKFQAIYLANEGGGSGGGGETLSELKGNNGQQMISTGSGGGDKVKKFFGICVGEGSENGCKNAQGGFVVLVGDDPDVTDVMTWEKLKSENWGQTSLVRSGQVYNGLFDNKFWLGHSQRTGSNLNRLKLQTFLQKHKHKDKMAQILCPWSLKWDKPLYNMLQAHCKNLWETKLKERKGSLFDFLTDDSARNYFNQKNWINYGVGWEGLAFLTLISLWSADLSQVNYRGSDDVFRREIDKFKLEKLSTPDGNVIFVEADSDQKRVTSITKYSKKEWTVLLQDSSNEHNGSGQSLSVTLSEGQLCIRVLVCLIDSELNQQRDAIKNNLRAIDQSYFGSLWNLLFKDSRWQWDYKNAFMALIAACFKDVEKVSFTVQEPSGRGEMIFTHLK